MGIKIKFLNPVSQEKFLHNLLNAKKGNSNYKHFNHKFFQEVKDKVVFRIFDDKLKNLVNCEIDFYPNDVIHIECEANNYDELQSLLVFDLLEAINERAVVRYVDSKIFFNGDVEFYFISDGPRQEIQKVSSDRRNLLEVSNSRIVTQIKQILEEINRVDFI